MASFPSPKSKTLEKNEQDSVELLESVEDNMQQSSDTIVQKSDYKPRDRKQSKFATAQDLI